MKLLIGQRARVAGLAFPDERGFVPPPGDKMTVETVVGNIDLAAGEPLRERRLPIEHPRERLIPLQLASDPGPEGFRVILGFLEEGIVELGRHMGTARELGVGRKQPVLLQDGIDVGHARDPRWKAKRLIVPSYFLGAQGSSSPEHLARAAGFLSAGVPFASLAAARAAHRLPLDLSCPKQSRVPRDPRRASRLTRTGQ